jgi:hypothetical protein
MGYMLLKCSRRKRAKTEESGYSKGAALSLGEIGYESS